MQRTIIHFRVIAGLLALMIGLVMSGPVSGLGLEQVGYPPPVEAPQIEEPPIAQPDTFPYPPTEAGHDAIAPLPVVGSQATEQMDRQNSGAGIPDTQLTGDHGLLFLWLSFFITLLVFLACTIGAAILFTRRNET